MTQAAFSAVLFDLDGTLLDTLEDITDAVNSVLTAGGAPPHPSSAYKRFVGDGLRDLALRAFPQDFLEREGVEACAAAVRREYERRWNVKTRPYPGIPELLDELGSRGVALAVLSNKVDDMTRLSVRTFLPRWRFAVVRGAVLGTPLKPDPAAALEIASRMDMDPGEILYLGDTCTDMRTAVAAGMYPAGALWGFRDADELRGSGAKVLIERPADLLGLLGGGRP